MRHINQIAMLFSLVMALLVNPASTVTAGAQEGGGGGPELLGVSAVGLTGPWEPQNPAAFYPFTRTGAGTLVKAKGAGLQYVHISVPIAYMLENTFNYLGAVTFCAKSTNPKVTRPVKMVVWTGGTVAGSKSVSWAPNTGPQCFSYSFNPAVFASDVTISVQLQVANATDTITFTRAEIVTRHD